MLLGKLPQVLVHDFAPPSTGPEEVNHYVVTCEARGKVQQAHSHDLSLVGRLGCARLSLTADAVSCLCQIDLTCSFC